MVDETFEHWHARPGNCGEYVQPGGIRYCVNGDGTDRPSGMIRWNGNPFPDIERNPRFRGKTCREVFDEERGAPAKPGHSNWADGNLKNAGSVLTEEMLAAAMRERLHYYYGHSPVTPIFEKRPLAEPEIARLQATADNHAGKGFTLYAGLMTSVRGCARCRRVVYSRSFCSACGDTVTHFHPNPGEKIL